MILTVEWRGRGRGRGSAAFPWSAPPQYNSRKKIKVFEPLKAVNSQLNTKRANLSAARKERIELPTFDNYQGTSTLHIGEFLSRPSGVEAMLNTRTLQSFQLMEDKIYRCTLPKVQLLYFEASPVLDLRVTPTDDECTVEMLSCKLDGSKVLERQNDYFSALMSNRMTWVKDGSNAFLEADVKLDLSLEIYTLPFTMMPTAAVENPGNLMLQTLLDRLVPLLLKQLVQDYERWVRHQLRQLQ